jgi:2-keto-4-pentenoate hydratase/2-oxohepta-3-ene-1,7-dioic acid hydratase in catechol pathway
MKILTFNKGGIRVGVLTERGILDLPKAYTILYETETAPTFLYDLKELISLGKPVKEIVNEIVRKERDLPEEAFHSPASIKWEPPVKDPEKIILPAVNYKAHGAEAKLTPPPSKPYLFLKTANSLIGHEEPIIKPRISSKVDWEVELAVIIGKKGKYIEERKAKDYIFGYTILNDISIRDWQFPEGWPEKLNQYGQNWFWGKAMDTAAPVGPFIVTKDEIEDPHKLRLMLKVNGEVQQDDNTENLIFNVYQLIMWASMGVTLKPGDYISTGTPQGVGFPRGKFLKENDVVESIIERIGTLRNKVIQEK